MNTAKPLLDPRSACVLGSVLLLLSGQEVTAQPGDLPDLNWEQGRLFHPSQALLLAEEKGRVTLYDGLYQTDVERALDQQFGRIDRMMFIRTRHRTDNGDVMDDDCD